MILSLVCVLSTKADVKFTGSDASQPFLPDSTTTITYIDNFSMKNVGEGKRLAKPIKSRAERTSPHAANIRIEASDVSQEIIDCAELAVSIWESILDRNAVFKIRIMNSNNISDIVTTVAYFPKDGINYPYALKYIDTDPVEGDNIPLAGVIQLNKNIDWDYSVDGNIDISRKNLTYGLMRAIGRILGFGSSIKVDTKGNFTFSNRKGHSVFDQLIVSADEISLCTIPLKNAESQLAAYLEKAPHYVTDGSQSYVLAPAPYSESNPPLTALVDGLMKPVIYPGEYCIQVDDDVWNILKMIGWKLKSEDALDIVCPDATNGIVDGGESHDFHISNKRITLSDPQWTLSLPLINGEQSVTELKDEGGYCTVPSISNDASKFEMDINGFIRGRLEYTGTYKGIKIKAMPYNIYFDTEPRILSVDIDSLNYSEDKSFYKIHYTVRFRGADYLDVLPKEQYSSIVVVKTFREPVLVRDSTDWLFSGGQVRLKFCAKTSSKECSRTIIFDPFTQEYREMSKELNSKGSILDVNCINSDGEDTIDVYSLDGTPVLKDVSESEIAGRRLDKGLYILNRKNTKGKIQSSKIILK